MLYPEALTHVAFQRIARTELEFLRGLDHERWLLFDLNGNLLDMVDGSRYQVGISAEVIRQLKPAASSHNHLWEVAHSEDDVLTAIHSDFLEARVIGPAHRYRLARPTMG